MEVDKLEGQYTIKGGKTILGKIFAYQEKTGQSVHEILRMPYVQFVLSMLDVPTVDYASKGTKKDNVKKPQTQEEEINLIAAALR